MLPLRANSIYIFMRIYLYLRFKSTKVEFRDNPMIRLYRIRSNNISANRKRWDPNSMKHKERFEWHELVVTVSSCMISEMSTATTIVVISYHKYPHWLHELLQWVDAKFMSQCTEFLSQDPTVMERLHHNAGYLKKTQKRWRYPPKRKGERKRDEKTEEDQTWNQEEKQETILKTQWAYSCENKKVDFGKLPTWNWEALERIILKIPEAYTPYTKLSFFSKLLVHLSRNFEE